MLADEPARNVIFLQLPNYLVVEVAWADHEFTMRTRCGRCRALNIASCEARREQVDKAAATYVVHCWGRCSGCDFEPELVHSKPLQVAMCAQLADRMERLLKYDNLRDGAFLVNLKVPIHYAAP